MSRIFEMTQMTCLCHRLSKGIAKTMKADLIIFGAGKNAGSYYDWALLAGYNVLFFVDNDFSKWGQSIGALSIHSPGILKEYKCTIMYPFQYKNEICRQLEEIQYQGNKVSSEEFKKLVVCEKSDNFDLTDIQLKKETGFLIDSYFSGTNWGGIESWSCMVGNQLSKLGIRTQIICGMNKKFDKYGVNCLHFLKEDELCMIKKIANKIIDFLPCVFISHASIALYAAEIIKSIFPNYIQIVLVAHRDIEEDYEKFVFWSDRVDKIVCISQKIMNQFQGKYKLGQNLLIYKPNPINIPQGYKKKEINKKVLKIGYAARLVKEAKRVELLPEVIEKCINKNLNIEFNIAGEGECQDLLRSYISEKHLENKVHMLGWISQTEMINFWREQDIYLNISNFEGMSLTMLEAMACGAVPITTDVSGVSDLIEDGKNGFVIPVNNWLEAADKIEMLVNDRILLSMASNYNSDLVKKKCDINDYAKWMAQTFD